MSEPDPSFSSLVPKVLIFLCLKYYFVTVGSRCGARRKSQLQRKDGVGDVVQLVECLPSMCRALGSVPAVRRPSMGGHVCNPSMWRLGMKVSVIQS